jgi:hypothetical protein
VSAERFFDNMARTLAEPMARRRAGPAVLQLLETDWNPAAFPANRAGWR